MQAYYYWDPKDNESYDQLLFSIFNGQNPNRVYRARDNEFRMEERNPNLFPFFRITSEMKFDCRPIFIRTSAGAALLTLVNNQIKVLAETAPGSSQGRIQSGFDISIPHLDKDHSTILTNYPNKVFQDCIFDVDRRISLLALLGHNIGQIQNPEIARLSKIRVPIINYIAVNDLIKRGRVLTYVKLYDDPQSGNSIFLFVSDEGGTSLTLLQYKAETNTVHPPLAQ